MGRWRNSCAPTAKGLCLYAPSNESLSRRASKRKLNMCCARFKLNGLVGVSQERKLNGGVAFGGGTGAVAMWHRRVCFGSRALEMGPGFS
jgi:hypothetical protein